MSGGESDHSQREWIPTIQAHSLVQDLLGIEDSVKASAALLRWAASGHVMARCRLHRFWSSADTQDYEDTPDTQVRPPFWHAFLIAKKAEASDWATGYFQIGYFEQETYTDDHQAVWDVDFDADQIREKASSLPRIPTTKSKADGQAKPRRQDLPILPEPIAQAWMRWFKSQPDANQERAQQSALHMFPNHNLSRERVRDLLGPVQLGAPQKTAK